MQPNLQNQTELTDRVHTTRLAPKPPKFVRERLAEAAEKLNRVTELATYTEVSNEAIVKLTAMLYEPAIDGEFANVDTVNGRILVPVPWGDNGWQAWGLRNWEAVVLRRILRQRCLSTKPVSLFDFNEQSNRWHLDIAAYPTRDSAFAYLKQFPITAEEWRAFSEAYRRKRERQRLKRQTK